jgi:hypothetical protein
MSIKTLRKRIALVAVSTLSIGLLTSVAPASATTVITIESNGGSATTGSNGLISSTDFGVAVAGGTDNTIITGATTATARVQVGGRVTVTAAAQSTTAVVRVLGATIGSWAAGGGSLSAINTAGTVVTGEASQTLAVATSAPSTAGATYTIELWEAISNYSTGSDATVKITVTTVATGTQNVFSATSTSNVFSLNTTSTGSTNDESGASYVDHSETGVYVNYALHDANDVDLVNAVIGCSATGAVLVAINSTSATDLLGATATGVDTDGAGYCYVKRAVANTPASSVVTLTVNGVSVGTKAATFVGEAAKVVVSDVVRQTTLSSELTKTDSYAFNVLDAAGNTLSSRTVAIASSGLNAIVTGATGGSTAAYNAAALTTGGWTCSGTAGSADLVAYALKADGLTRVNSDPFKAWCVGNPYTYTASLDKASYVPGDIATLTITAKDSKGNLTNGYATLGLTASPVAISGSQLTAVTAPTNGDKFTSAAGVKTYKFVVGTTEGSYNMIVDLPQWNSSGVQSAVTVAYKVAASSATVTTNEVLAAIVKLIATINKQIRQLQKQLRR